MKRSTMVKLIEMQIKSDGLIQRSPVPSTEDFASRILHAVMKAGMIPRPDKYSVLTEEGMVKMPLGTFEAE